MDRETIVRKQRRRQVEDVLHDERGREAALAERLEEIVAETDGPRFDERVFERLEAEDVTFVREVLGPASPLEDATEDAVDDEDAADEGWADEEIARLQDEIAESRRRQLAYERYLDALGA